MSIKIVILIYGGTTNIYGVQTNNLILFMKYFQCYNSMTDNIKMI